MISDLDIWRGANLLIRQHGADAELEAARLEDLMLDRAMTRGGGCGRGSGERSRRYAVRAAAGRTEIAACGGAHDPTMIRPGSTARRGRK